MKYKWKKYLTAEEAALLLTGLEQYDSLAGVQFLEDIDDSYLIKRVDYDVFDFSELDERDQLLARFQEAKVIYEELLNEIFIADELDQNNAVSDVQSHLEIVVRAQVNEFEYYLKPEECQLTKKSIANWVYEIDTEKAKILNPNIEFEYKGLEKTKAREYKAVSSEEKLLESIGILSLILAEKSGVYKRGEGPNASAIQKAIAEYSGEVFKDGSGFSNLNKDITAAVEYVNQNLIRK